MIFKTLIVVAASRALAVPALAQERPAACVRAAQNPAIKSPDAITWGDLAKGHNSFTAAQAMRRRVPFAVDAAYAPGLSQ